MHTIKLYFTAYCLTECLFLCFFSPSFLLLWTANFKLRFSQSAPATVQRLKPVIISSFCLMRKVANNKPWNLQWQCGITRTEMLRAKYCSSWSPNCYLPSRLMKKDWILLLPEWYSVRMQNNIKTKGKNVTFVIYLRGVEAGIYEKRNVWGKKASRMNQPSVKVNTMTVDRGLISQWKCQIYHSHI